MSYNGSGAFQINTAGQPVVVATTIDATVFNTLTADVATGLSTAICKDGQTTITADIPLNAHKLTGVAAATARTDAASLATIQDGTGVYVATVAGTADVITLTASPAIAAYVAGQTFQFIASGANTTNVTVAINGLAAKAITKNGTTALVANDILSGMMVRMTYDGTRFILGTHLTADVATLAGTQTLTNKTITAPTFSGTAAGSLTNLALTTPTLTGGLVAADPTAALGIASKQYADAQGGIFVIVNGSLSVTMAANAVTIALKGNDGNDPSASNIVRILFRSATLTSSVLVSRSITAALSTVISSGSTGGTVNATAARIYVGALDNAGTVELFWWNSVSGTNLFAPQEQELITTIAEGGAGAADSAHVLYSTTARSSVAHRTLGYFEATEATAGTWATAASKVQVMGPGVKRTGEYVQMQRSVTGAVATGTTTTPIDDSIPQITEGDQYLSQAITPSNTINILEVSAGWNVASSINGEFTIGLHQDAIANALAAWRTGSTTASNICMSGSFTHYLAAGTTSATTFRIRIGSNGGTTTFNGASGARLMGGVLVSKIMIAEIFA